LPFIDPECSYRRVGLRSRGAELPKCAIARSDGKLYGTVKHCERAQRSELPAGGRGCRERAQRSELRAGGRGRRERAQRSEPPERSEAAKRRASDGAGESEGRRPSDQR